jgi:hypothetical protein
MSEGLEGWTRQVRIKPKLNRQERQERQANAKKMALDSQFLNSPLGVLGVLGGSIPCFLGGSISLLVQFRHSRRFNCYCSFVRSRSCTILGLRPRAFFITIPKSELKAACLPAL